jgi:hypothetical protein
VIPGHWDPVARQFTTPAASLFDTNAVQVNVGREASRGNPLPVWLARAFLGSQPGNPAAPAVTQMDVQASAIAVGGGPCGDDCSLPIVLPACQLMNGGELQCNQLLRFANDHEDTTGFTSLDLGHVGTATVRAILRDLYQNGTCRAAGPQMRLENGNNINPVAEDFLCAMNRAEASGLDLTMPVVAENGVVDPFATCENPTFNQTWQCVGYARVHICWATGANTCNSLPHRTTYCDGTPLPEGIDRVYCDAPQATANCPGNPDAFGGSRPTIEWNPACGTIPARGLPCTPQTIYMSNQCEVVERAPQPAGCGFFGIENSRPQLVR